MKDNSKLPLTENPDHFILQVGTNNLNSDREPELTKWQLELAKLIMMLIYQWKKKKAM